MKHFASISFLTVVFIWFAGCSSPSETDDGGGDGGSDGSSIVTDWSTSVLTDDIGTSGGTITVPATGSPVDGLSLTVPPNSFDSPIDVNIGYAEIVSHDLGEFFEPIAPLIRITTNAGFSDSIMTVSIPVSVEPGEFAMAWAYDEVIQEVEGLPVLDLAGGMLTIGTRHFATSSIYGEGKSALGMAGDVSYMNLIISAIDKSKLAEQGVISSSFLPGRDDWEFVNQGSYIAPKGHCAGQAMTALWYHETIGSPQLFGLLDTNPELSQDNPLGYKFASTVQEDQNFRGWIDGLRWLHQSDELSFNAFALAILQTGRPQSVLIRNSQGRGGHAMIIYEVDYPGGILKVADPNYPGNKHFASGVETNRLIKFVNGAFEPYESGLRAGDAPYLMDHIGFSGKSAFADWARIAERWQEVQDGTIGNDRFPTVKITMNLWGGNEWPEVTEDEVEVAIDSIRFLARCGELPIDRMWGVLHFESRERSELSYVKLKPGRNLIGHEARGKLRSGISAPDEWLDFEYITYILENIWIEPANSIGQVDTELPFTARGGGFPAQPQFKWDFGDGTGVQTITGDSAATHTYTATGEYEIALQVFDQGDGSLFGEATAYVEIVSGGMSIVRVEPNLVTNGDTMSIKGIGFGDGAYYSAYFTYTQVFQGLGAYEIDPTDSEVITWTDTLIQVIVPDYLSTGDILIAERAPGTAESNRHRVQVLPVITEVQVSGESTPPYQTWPGGPLITLNGTGLRSYTSDPVITLAGMTIDIDTAHVGDFNFITVTPIPDGAQSGPIQVTVEGIASNTEPIKIGIEDWLPDFDDEIEPGFHNKIIQRDVNSGATRSVFVFGTLSLPPIEGDVVWSGTSFTMNIDPPGGLGWRTRISGSINGDGTMLEQVDYSVEYHFSDDYFVHWILNCSDLPLEGADEGSYALYSFSGTNAEVLSHIEYLEYRTFDQRGGEGHDWRFDSYDWLYDNASVSFHLRKIE